MPQDRLMQAIGRMERAVGRVETALPSVNGANPGDPELAARHERLKQDTMAAIGEIDRLLSQVKG